MAHGKSADAAEKTHAMFRASEQRDQAIRKEIAKERAAVEARTARLRALRLAKEAADRETVAANAPPAPVRARRPVRKKAPKSA